MPYKLSFKKEKQTLEENAIGEADAEALITIAKTPQADKLII